jgi:imidazolonepropionase-like amidohydrolase
MLRTTISHSRLLNRYVALAALLSITSVWAQTQTPTPTPATTIYNVVVQDKIVGKQTTTIIDGGAINVDFSYRNNGRGPDILEKIIVRRDGQMESLTTTGKSTFGAPIDETFSRVNGKAVWKSNADRGEQTGVESAVYVPLESSVEALAIAARSLLRAKDNKLAALPSGQLSISKLQEATLEIASKKSSVILYSVAGLGLEPAFVWLRASAEQSLFAVVAPGFAVIEAGWESEIAKLLKLQQSAENVLLKSLAEKFTKRTDGVTVIRNVRVFDSEKAQMLPASDVYVFRGKIASVFPAGSSLRSAATVIDGTGKTLLPGLFDMHGHTSAWDSALQIAGGVTTLRDMGNDNANLNELKTMVDAGNAIGPHIIPTGFIEGESPFSAQLGFVVKDMAGATDAINWYAQHGYRQIKLYNSIRPEWVTPITEYAHARGMRVSGHIPAFMRAEEAVRAGFDEIQHINQVMLNFLVKKDDDTRTLLRFYLVGDNANQIDLESQKVKDFVKLLRERGTVVDPTLTAFEAMFNQRQGAANPSFKFVANNVPPALRRGWLTNSMDVTDKNAEAFRVSYQKLLGLVKKMHDAGIPIVAGTDDIAGFTLHRELELYVMAGLKPAEVLKIATWNGAKYSQVLETAGSISPGKQADLILVDGDPSASISDIRKVSMTMKNGLIFYPAELYEALGVKRFTEPPKLSIVASKAENGIETPQ